MCKKGAALELHQEINDWLARHSEFLVALLEHVENKEGICDSKKMILHLAVVKAVQGFIEFEDLNNQIIKLLDEEEMSGDMDLDDITRILSFNVPPSEA